jgi:hypothetical protein
LAAIRSRLFCSRLGSSLYGRVVSRKPSIVIGSGQQLSEHELFQLRLQHPDFLQMQR